MKQRSHVWLGIVATVLAAFTVASATLRQSYGLTAFCDITESLLLISGMAALFPLAVRSRGRLRLFWSLIILGVTLWFSYQMMWTYFEVLLHQEVPDIFSGDVVLFLNIVPLMAALALRPHLPRDEYSARLGRLDFALLLIWWFYLYALMVIPWQYVEPDVDAYNRNLNAVYLTEKIAFLAGLAYCWMGSKGKWKKIYGSLFGMSFCYSFSSAIANWAIARHVYYSGSYYDIPLAVAMAWLTWIGLRTEAEEPQPQPHTQGASSVYGVWVARCGMLALFSLPLFAAWSLSETVVPPHIRLFRLELTLAVAFVMGVGVFVRQRLLDRELIQLLNHSQDSCDHLKKLQVQILHSEKLASIGQLVGGAAHELNNPITAMLGYSDLLLSTPLNSEQEAVAAKIGQQVRRTKSLVATLISFARQGPAPKGPIDLNTLARTAVKLTQPQWKPLNVEVRSQFDPSLPKIQGDSNQLLQVCLQLIANCLHVMSEQGSKLLEVRTERRAGTSLLQIAACLASPSALGEDTEPGSSGSSQEDLALSACRGILQEHQGNLTRQVNDRQLVLSAELPAIEMPAPRLKEGTVPILWQSQPFA